MQHFFLGYISEVKPCTAGVNYTYRIAWDSEIIARVNRKFMWLVLGNLQKMGPVNSKRLVEKCGTLEDALAWCSKHRPDFISAKKAATASIEWSANHGTDLLSLEDPNYPRLWREMPDAPTVIFVRGQSKWANLRTHLAVVGTRRCSEMAARMAFEVSRRISEQGHCITSGLARGIDAAAHRGALFTGHPTVACLAHGLDRLYPKAHSELAAAMVREGGAMWTEHAPGTVPLAWHFASRNRLVVGLSQGLVMVESPLRGGAMISAELALEMGRDLWVWRPTSRNHWRSAGNRVLLEQFPESGWSSPEELLIKIQRTQLISVSNIPSEQKFPPKQLSPIWQSLVGTSGKQATELAGEFGLTMASVYDRLLMLELGGWVKRLPGGWYVAWASAWGRIPG